MARAAARRKCASSFQPRALRSLMCLMHERGGLKRGFTSDTRTHPMRQSAQFVMKQRDQFVCERAFARAIGGFYAAILAAWNRVTANVLPSVGRLLQQMDPERRRDPAGGTCLPAPPRSGRRRLLLSRVPLRVKAARLAQKLHRASDCPCPSGRAFRAAPRGSSTHTGSSRPARPATHSDASGTRRNRRCLPPAGAPARSPRR